MGSQRFRQDWNEWTTKTPWKQDWWRGKNPLFHPLKWDTLLLFPRQLLSPACLLLSGSFSLPFCFLKYRDLWFHWEETHSDSNTILVGDLNLPLSDLDKSNQKINKKEVREVNEILEKLELIDMWRIDNRDKKGIHFLFSSSWYIHYDWPCTRA